MIGEARKIVLSGQFAQSALAVLTSRAGLELLQLASDDPDEMKSALRDAHALMVRTAVVSESTLRSASHLEVVSRNGVGFDNIAVEVLTELGIPLATTGNTNAAAVAEHTIALMLHRMRRLDEQDAAVRRGTWGYREKLSSKDLAGKTALLVGFGRIGREVARRLLAFDCKILAFDPFLDGDPGIAKVTYVQSLHKALGIADVVSLHLPLTGKNHHIIGAKALSSIKPGALLINTSRGGLVDEAAVSRALHSGRLSGAAFDVFEGEPPSADNPLLKAPNTVFSPHSASLTVECTISMARVCAQNVLDALDGRLNPKMIANPDFLKHRARLVSRTPSGSDHAQ